MVQSIYSRKAAQHRNPIPNAAVHHGLLVTSSISGMDLTTDAYFPDPADQFRSVFDQLVDILSEAGGSVQDIVKIDLYLADKNNRSLANDRWERLWPDKNHRPARQAHQADLPDGCVVQIVATAFVSHVTQESVEHRQENS
ncbi:hypothetical protein AB833_05020 [Chromatiales bacterium (ex Bugula neritina AB1)]|nr:hypothetical protein AB833_05020 [Chromatiales bacterium (ex Bugula neritina AB1)]